MEKMQFIVLGLLVVTVLGYVNAGYGYGTRENTRVAPEESSADVNFVTVTFTTTRTHTLRKTSTIDVHVTSAAVVPVRVTQYLTQREYVEGNPDTVTSFIRITSTPIVISTRTIEKMPVRTVVSRYTDLRTVTSTVDLWQPITHYETSFEVVRLPVQETQTLLQVLYDTITTASRSFVTRTHGIYAYGY